MEYEDLETAYERSERVCDPIDFAYRQHRLLKAVVEYLLERDQPQQEEDDS